jgi:hypothetical protein
MRSLTGADLLPIGLTPLAVARMPDAVRQIAGGNRRDQPGRCEVNASNTLGSLTAFMSAPMKPRSLRQHRGADTHLVREAPVIIQTCSAMVTSSGAGHRGHLAGSLDGPSTGHGLQHTSCHAGNRSECVGNLVCYQSYRDTEGGAARRRSCAVTTAQSRSRRAVSLHVGDVV